MAHLNGLSPVRNLICTLFIKIDSPLHHRSYVMVSVEEKMDRRTVEDIQAEIREKKKRQKLNEEDDQVADGGDS